MIITIIYLFRQQKHIYKILSLLHEFAHLLSVEACDESKNCWKKIEKEKEKINEK